MSLEGRLEDMGLADIFQIIGISKRSGVLTLIRKEGTGRLVFNQGQVIFASSDTRNRLGYTLVKKGIISNEDLEYALRIQKGRGSKKPIGTILIELGSLDQQTFEKELYSHVVSVVHDLLSWESGSFHFQLSSLEDDQIIFNVGFGTESLLLEAYRVKDEEERESKEREQKVPLESPEKGQKSNTTSTEPATKTAPAQSTTLIERKDLQLLSSMISELSKPSASTELTLMILRFASEIMNRAVVFLVREVDVVGLGQFGLSFSPGNEQGQIRSVRIPLSEPSIFKEVAEKQMIYKGSLSENKWHRYLIDHLSGEWPGEVFVAPVNCVGRVVAILYGDNLPDKEPIRETEGLEAFIKVAELAFSKALLERKFQETNSSKS
jgi:uncharacterized protein YejL (UPF0352 family)